MYFAYVGRMADEETVLLRVGQVIEWVDWNLSWDVLCGNKKPPGVSRR